MPSVYSRPRSNGPVDSRPRQRWAPVSVRAKSSVASRTQQIAVANHKTAAPETEARVLRLRVEPHGQHGRLDPGDCIGERLGR